jgi:hypothetical protein
MGNEKIKLSLAITLLIILYGCYCPDIDENSFSFKPKPIVSENLMFNTPYIAIDSFTLGKYDSNYYVNVFIFYNNGKFASIEHYRLNFENMNDKYRVQYGVYNIVKDSITLEIFGNCYWLNQRIIGAIKDKEFKTFGYTYYQNKYYKTSGKIQNWRHSFIPITYINNSISIFQKNRFRLDIGSLNQILKPFLEYDPTNPRVKWKY